ncbi:MAG: PHP domain-containing protein [Deltaproteobacteria bacterium]|nr:PHP domain-containing protein [Deltaproteobacteria bacterium]
MKRWQAYSKDLLCGDWQVHTTWSDGKNSILEYCAEARRQGLRLIAFTEHVRRELRYDFWAYVREVEEARRRFPDLQILAGCEAKVLSPQGELDAPADVLERSNIVLGAFHSFAHPERYLEALEAMLCNPWVDIWAHPTLYARKHGLVLTEHEEERLVRLCRDKQVLIEFNGKYSLPGPSLREKVKALGAPYVYGSDAHSVAELGRQQKQRF